MREIVLIQAGQCGNQVGEKVSTTSRATRARKFAVGGEGADRMGMASSQNAVMWGCGTHEREREGE